MNETLVMSATAALVLLIGLHIGILWKNLKAMRQLATHDERLSHLADALALLTDTSESGFNAVAAEVGRLAETGTPTAPTALANRRLATQARRGRSVQQIAAAEGVSEGEIRLRLHLVEQGLGKTTTPAATAPSSKPAAAQSSKAAAAPSSKPAAWPARPVAAAQTNPAPAVTRAAASATKPTKARERRVTAPVATAPAKVAAAADTTPKRRTRTTVRLPEKADGAVRE